jgi:uncharacterized protein (DUF1800 family)
MKRRDFFYSKKGDELQTADFGEYNQNMSTDEAVHFLRRLCFYPSTELVKQITGMKPSAAFDLIISADDKTLPSPNSSMLSWIDVIEEDPLNGLPNDVRYEIEAQHKAHYQEFIDWWAGLMSTEQYSAREKMVHFLTSVWSIEFTYDTLALLPPPLLYRNNQTLRGLWNEGYNNIAEAMVLDGAMLMYQSLFYSTKDKPNENFMRELMELFTMGIGDIVSGETNYTEADIREGSKALTGWRTVAYIGQDGAPANHPYQTFFIKDAHDTGAKTLYQFGSISPISDAENTEDLVKENEVTGLINILFIQRGEQISRFIAEKLYRYYIYSNPGEISPSTIEQVAQFIRDNEYNLVKTLKMLLTSNMFFSDDIRGCQIKNPSEYIIGLERMLGTSASTSVQLSDAVLISNLEQSLYDPPNVGSWKAYRSWINTNTYPLRVKYADQLLTGISILSLAKKFDNYTNPNLLLTALISYFLPKPAMISAQRLSGLSTIILNGLSSAQWTVQMQAEANAPLEGIYNLIKEFFYSPDFQLC